MKMVPLGKSGLQVPAIAVGCMRIGEMPAEKLAEHIRWCVDHGLNFLITPTFMGAAAARKISERLSVRPDSAAIRSSSSPNAVSVRECMIFQKNTSFRQ